MRSKPRLRWKKDPKETGLSAVASDPAQRPSELHDGTRCYATVYSHGYHALSRFEGWYWVANDEDVGVPYRNTCDSPVATEAEAKAAALGYVRTCIAKATPAAQGDA